MILNGKIIGVVGGPLLSWTSSLTSSAIGFYLGRSTAKGFNRLFSEKEIHQGNLFFEKYGDLSIAVSKGIPILSEVVSFISGNTAIPFKRFFLYSMAGHMAVSLIYAWVGSYVAELNSYWVSGAVILGTVGLFLALRVFAGTKHHMQRG
jgi:membrane protein DedA with SNARE-associated domain